MADSMKIYHGGNMLPIGPLWLRSLLETSFFIPCSVHTETNKNECNQFCLDCTGPALCSSCLVGHKDHHIVQIRRSSYHDVIRVSEIQRILDITGIQTYIINGARVVFINGRPQPRQGKGVTNNCEICDRSLLDSFRYCSLGCKVEGIKRRLGMTFLVHAKSQNIMARGSDSEESFQKKVRFRKTVQQLHDDTGDSVSVDGATSFEEQLETLYQDIDQIYRAGFISLPHNLNEVNDLSPPTPPPTARSSRRRKGVPHRAPMGM